MVLSLDSKNYAFNPDEWHRDLFFIVYDCVSAHCYIDYSDDLYYWSLPVHMLLLAENICSFWQSNAWITI